MRVGIVPVCRDVGVAVGPIERDRILLGLTGGQDHLAGTRRGRARLQGRQQLGGIAAPPRPRCHIHPAHLGSGLVFAEGPAAHRNRLVVDIADQESTLGFGKLTRIERLTVRTAIDLDVVLLHVIDHGQRMRMVQPGGLENQHPTKPRQARYRPYPDLSRRQPLVPVIAHVSSNATSSARKCRVSAHVSADAARGQRLAAKPRRGTQATTDWGCRRLRRTRSTVGFGHSPGRRHQRGAGPVHSAARRPNSGRSRGTRPPG